MSGQQASSVRSQPGTNASASEPATGMLRSQVASKSLEARSRRFNPEGRGNSGLVGQRLSALSTRNYICHTTLEMGC